MGGTWQRCLSPESTESTAGSKNDSSGDAARGLEGPQHSSRPATVGGAGLCPISRKRRRQPDFGELPARPGWREGRRGPRPSTPGVCPAESPARFCRESGRKAQQPRAQEPENGSNQTHHPHSRPGDCGGRAPRGDASRGRPAQQSSAMSQD